MMSNNKILTVSYGTFSCTLEGFDDSFDTMKAIAEYFRDLAADDRYFGAEPPQPDAEMLARIAEREIARRVEAHASDAGIHLRAGTVAALAAAEASAAPQHPVAEAAMPSGEKPAQDEVADAADGISAQEHAPEGAPDVTAAHAETAHAPEASPAADTGFGLPDYHGSAEIPAQTVADQTRAHDVTQAAPQSVPTDLMHASLDYSILTATNPVISPAQPDTAGAPQAHAEDPAPAEHRAEQAWHDASNDVDHDLTAHDIAATFAQMEAEEDIPVAEEMPVTARRPAPNSIADKLQRIRAVVSKSHPAPNTFSEDEHAEEIVDAKILHEEESDAAFRMAEFFAHGTGTAADDAEEEPLAEIARTEETEEPALAAEEPAASATEEVTAESDVVADDTSEADAAVVDDDDADLAATLARLNEELDGEATRDEPDVVARTDEVAEHAPDEDGSEYNFSSLFADDDGSESRVPDVEEDAHEASEGLIPSLRARVIKVKRTEIRAALDAGMLEEDNDDAEQSDDPEEPADVASETDAEAAAEAEESADDKSPDEPSATRKLEDAASADEEELDRLMAEADQQMEEPEGNSRRAAFDHLRGAVEATKADGDLGSDDHATGEDEYRTDLAAAVTPRRPVSGGRTDRPRDQRPAPLKLVAEQRIDVPSARTGPVQPRRVAAAPQSEPGENDGSFADYAASRGAHDLPELLEAAASYLSFVEGRDQFSRPQLMTKVRQLDPDGFSREDGLRHFGKLLRSGKIEKLSGGRFTVSDDIGFRPDGERAVG